MTLAPTLAQILVRVLPAETERKTESGLVVIPDNATAKYLRGEIIAVGPKVESECIQPGRVLRWREATGIKMRHSGITHPAFEGSPPVRDAPGRQQHATGASSDSEYRVVNEESALCVEMPEDAAASVSA